MKKTFWSELVFWLHLPIILVWFGLFLVPKSIWPSRVVFHFWYITVIMLIQLFWGFVLMSYTKKIDFICPQTTLMQWLRGIPVKRKENYQHSFIAELFQKLRIPINYRGVNILLLITLGIVAVQYVWFR